MRLVYILFFASGAVALAYEVLWLKELALLFGSTARASAATLAVFFLGLGCGGLYWGRRARDMRNPLRVYGLLELAVAATAGLYFLISALYRSLYPWLFSLFQGHPLAFTLAKGVLCLGLLFPPAFFMGGTLPAMGQHVIRGPRQLASHGAGLYALNTAGAVAGVLLAGFLFPPRLGFSRSYLAAMATGVLIGAASLWLARSGVASPGEKPGKSATQPGGFVSFLAFCSGLLALALEVLWTRMAAHSVQNSVYAFSMILVVFLLALAGGGLAANRLSRLRAAPDKVLAVLLALSSLAVAATPRVFLWLSPDLAPLAPGKDWIPYLLSVSGALFLAVGAPTLILGTVFPYLLRLEQERAERAGVCPGAVLGRLSGLNTLGAILGSLGAGFVLLEYVGMWRSIQVPALAYALLSLAAWRRGRSRVLALAAPAVLASAAALVLLARPPATLVSLGPDMVLKSVREDSQATVAVLEQVLEGGEKRLWLRVNNHYVLSGTHTVFLQRLQARLPLALHPNPKRVFFLGLGTGITAGGALALDLDSVTVCELLSGVALASRDYFGPYLNGLFEDPRVDLVVEDGRNYLQGTSQRYDVIIADLFLTWKAGTGSLYTREHFQNAYNRLEEGGLFAQWIPLHSNTRLQFDIVAREMLGVFDQVTLWKLNFWPFRPTALLLGHKGGAPLDPDALVRNRRLLEPDMPERAGFHIAFQLLHYSGNLTLVRHWFDHAPANTEDFPRLEYMSPVSERKAQSGDSPWFAGQEYINFLEQLHRAAPPRDDPYLAALPPHAREYATAGLELFRLRYYEKVDPEKVPECREALRELLPPDLEVLLGF